MDWGLSVQGTALRCHREGWGDKDGLLGGQAPLLARCTHECFPGKELAHIQPVMTVSGCRIMEARSDRHPGEQLW